jgi:UDP-glucose 4-epimerase
LEVRPLVRNDVSSTDIMNSVAVGNIESVRNWTELLKGTDAIVHLAARAHRPLRVQQIEKDLYFEVNVSATRQLAQAAAASGVHHFVFMSSIGVHGRSTDGRAPFAETDAINPDGIYAETKAEAERSLQEIASQTGMAVTVIRPVLVYGPGVKANVRHLARAVSRRIPLPLGSVRNRRAFVAVDNVCSLVVHRLQAKPSGFETYIVADDEQVSTPEFIRRIGKAIRRQPLLVPFPPSILKLGLRTAGMRQIADSLCSSLEVDTRAAKSIGWRPVITMQKELDCSFTDLE